MKPILWTLLALGLSLPLCGQTAFSKGDHMLELTGIINQYLDYFQAEQQEDQAAFNIRDIRFILAGEQQSSNFKYQLMVDFADLGAPDSLEQFLKDAYVNIDLPSKFDLFVGYQRLPFGRSSNVSIFSTVFSQRPDISGGALYYRRNLGLVLRKKMLSDRINLYGGAFNGGNGIQFNNQLANAPNRLTYVMRADIAFPTRVRFEALDIRQTPIPLFSVGLNAMYTQHEREVEAALFPLEVDGQKWITALDMAFFYQGLSLQLEVTRAWIHRGPGADNQSSGIHLAANYFFKELKSVLAIRYEDYNPDDSRYPDNFRALSFAYNLLLDQSQDKVLRIEYRHMLDEDNPVTPLRNARSWQVGWQFRF